MNLPGYDAWKLATPPEYDMTAEEEKAQMAEREQAISDAAHDLQGAVEDAISSLEGRGIKVNAIRVDAGNYAVMIETT